jgi:hypothetical protein
MGIVFTALSLLIKCSVNECLIIYNMNIYVVGHSVCFVHCCLHQQHMCQGIVRLLSTAVYTDFVHVSV